MYLVFGDSGIYYSNNLTEHNMSSKNTKAASTSLSEAEVSKLLTKAEFAVVSPSFSSSPLSSSNKKRASSASTGVLLTPLRVRQKISILKKLIDKQQVISRDLQRMGKQKKSTGLVQHRVSKELLNSKLKVKAFQEAHKRFQLLKTAMPAKKLAAPAQDKVNKNSQSGSRSKKRKTAIKHSLKEATVAKVALRNSKAKKKSLSKTRKSSSSSLGTVKQKRQGKAGAKKLGAGKKDAALVKSKRNVRAKKKASRVQANLKARRNKSEALQSKLKTPKTAPSSKVKSKKATRKAKMVVAKTRGTQHAMRRQRNRSRAILGRVRATKKRAQAKRDSR
jgi:hypothetical protein